MSPNRPRRPHGRGRRRGARLTPGWRGLLGLPVVVGLVLLTGCSGTSQQRSSTPAATTLVRQRAGTSSATTAAQQRPRPQASATLSDLADLGQLQALFNQQQGEARLLLLLSPT